MSDYIVSIIRNSGKLEKASEKLASVLRVVFLPASAKASVPGEHRAKACQALITGLPSLGKFEGFILESDEEKITVKNQDLSTVLNQVTEAYNAMEAIRARLAGNESKYKEIRESVSKVTKEAGKRGRKGTSYEDKYSLV